MSIHRNSKMSIHRQLMTGCAVGVLTFGLAACGGGGDDSALNSLQETLDALQTAYGADPLTPEAITQLQSDLGAANTRIGSDDEPMSLLGMLAAKIAEIGTADDPTSLMGMLADKTAEVMALMSTLGDETNPDMASVRGMLAARIAEIGTADDPASLMGMLAAANARIGTADDPDSLMGMLAAEKQKVTDLETRIAALERGTDPVLLTPIQTAAKDASDAAAPAETAAGAAADAAEKAAGTFADETMNQAKRATIQTGDANSADGAEDARTAADTAMAEAKKALDAYNAAVAAGDTTAANTALSDAQTAMRAAMTAQTDAEDAMKEAVADAAAELKIAATVKSVGDTMIDAAASSSVVTTDGTTVDTGLQDNELLPKQMVTTPPGMDAVEPDSTQTPAVRYMGPTAGVAATELTLGKTVDSADDMARLMIVTQYAGSKSVKVYASNNGADQMGTKAGYITIDDSDATTGVVDENGVIGNDLNNVRLRSAGVYYFALAAAALSNQASVAADAEAQRVYYYVTGEGDAAVRNHLVLQTEAEVTTGGTTTTTYTYSAAAIHVSVNTDGDDGTTPAVDVEVTAKIPEATDYQHIHFGVWAALGDAEDDGTHEIDDLGIGFVQNFSDSGLSGADMPNNGKADYTGNWVAAVQAMDEDGNGPMSLKNGVATIAADFGEGDITAKLTDLATLTGDIAGNQFSGTKAVATGSGLDTAADFEGTFSGGFYGAKGAEAGGVFDFEADDGEGGAFRGAFGGKK